MGVTFLFANLKVALIGSEKIIGHSSMSNVNQANFESAHLLYEMDTYLMPQVYVHLTDQSSSRISLCIFLCACNQCKFFLAGNSNFIFHLDM